MRRASPILVVAFAASGLFAVAAPAAAFENTVRVRVSPDRQWQCGDKFFATGGAARYQIAKVFLGDRLIGAFDFANPADCAKVLDDVVDLPDGGEAVVTVEVGGAKMGAKVLGRDRNRVWTYGMFIDHNNGELTQDNAPPRARPAAALAPAATPLGTFRNTVDLMVAKNRLWQCGDKFFSTGGSQTYRFARFLVGDKEVAKYDFAKESDCARVTTLVFNLHKNGKQVVAMEVGPYKMGADINAADRPRRYSVQFFVDQIWGEVTKDPE
jgi:hypothetical protein